MSQERIEAKARFEEFSAHFNKNVFVMMRYREDQRFIELENVIRNTLSIYDLKAQLAKDCAYYDDVWANIVWYIKNSKYGLAVFEEIDERE